MSYLHLLSVLLPASCALAMMFVVAFALTGPKLPGRREFGVFAAVTGFWCVTAAAEYLTVDFETRRVFGLSVYLGAAATPVAWLVFALRYLGATRFLSSRSIAGLCVVPVLTIILAYTTDRHGLIWTDVKMIHEPLPDLVVSHGWWFTWIHTPYSYGLYLLGLFVLLRHFFDDLAAYRRQTFGVILSSLLVFLVNVLYIGGLFSVQGMDPTPMLASVFIIGVAISLFRGFLGMAPLSYREIFMVSAEGAIMIDSGYRVVDINPAALSLSSDPDPIGRRLQDSFPWLTDEKGETAISSSAQHGGLLYAVREVVLRGSGGQPIGCAVLLRDITAEHRERAALQVMARVDSLTRVLNRGAFSDYVAERLNDRLESAPMALLFLDLDGFKAVNDQYGHRVGDQVLIETARRIENLLRPGDYVGRLGGDEFVIALDRAGRGVAEALVDRLRRSFEQAFQELGHGVENPVVVSASVGAAVWPEEGRNLDELLEVADQRMYRSKRKRALTSTYEAKVPPSSRTH
ncbi:MAG: histidine kinase N-terminal 7TM domain-containing protein [Pseudomonadota bacterium]